MNRLKISVKSIKNNRICIQCQIKDILAKTEEWYSAEGIIDTGAMTSCISNDFAEKINVSKVDKIFIADAIDFRETFYCFMDVSLGDINFNSIKTLIFPHPVGDFIIGMDILGQGVFSYKKIENEYEFVYTISQSSLSYTNTRNRMISSNILKKFTQK